MSSKTRWPTSKQLVLPHGVPDASSGLASAHPAMFWPSMGFSLMSWNSRAYLHHDGKKFNEKRRFAGKELRISSVGCLQE
eukprot:10308716-Karenia_brevis.AAC.1